MKFKKLFIALLATAFFTAHNAKAQSLEQKLRAQVQQQKQRQEAVLKKAKEQDQQRAAETRPMPPVVHPAGQNRGNNNQSGEPLRPRAQVSPAMPAAEPKTAPLSPTKKHEKKQQ